MKNYEYWERKSFNPSPIIYDCSRNHLSIIDVLCGRTDLLLIYFVHNFPLKVSENDFYYSDDISFLKSIDV